VCGFVVFVSDRKDGGMSVSDGLRAIRHRGPDESTLHTPEPGITMGFQRLAVVDITASHQPLSYPATGSEAGRWTLCFNGEIYNYRELRAELRQEHGAVFVTDGDTEVLAAAFHHWGPEAVHRLRGMFAYVLWDRDRRVLHAARDPFGIKPLYYRRTATGLWLASEKKALAGPAGAEALDPDALAHYLSLQYVPDPYTMHADVHQVPSGSRFRYRPGGDPDIERYFDPTFRPAAVPTHTLDRTRFAAGLAVELRDALRDSVRAHLVADVPVGALLSGGVDSTAVVALAREVLPDLTVFTAGFDIPGYSEIDLAAETARQLDVRHVPTVVTAADVMAALPRIVWHLDDPLADPSLTPLYFVTRTAADHVTVALSGEGADELFGGYEIYREPAAVAPVGRLPAPLRKALRRVAAVLPEGVRGRGYLERATTAIEQRYYGNARIFDGAEKDRVLRHRPAALRTTVTDSIYRETAHLDDVTRMQAVDLRTWLPGDVLAGADRMSMAHSLELRVPFLDRAVFEVARRVPAELRVPAGSRVTKALLREAVRGIVPDSTADRRKLGFATPVRVWLRGDMSEWAHDILTRSTAGDLLDLSYVRELLVAHQANLADHSRKIWTVLMFCLWYEIFIDGNGKRPDYAGSTARGAVSTQQKSLQLATHRCRRSPCDQQRCRQQSQGRDEPPAPEVRQAPDHREPVAVPDRCVRIGGVPE